MYSVFHMGVGMILMVGPEEVDGVIASLRDRGEGAWIMGIMEEGEGGALWG